MNDTGIDAPGVPTTKKQHLRNLLLKRYRKRIVSGFDDLERFDLINRLEKPVLNFAFYGTKRKILEIYDFISEFPYSLIAVISI